MRQVCKINELGIYLEPIIIGKDDELPANCIEQQPANGFYRPKWTGTTWIEDMTQEEIDALNNQPQEPTEIEMIMLAIADLDMQREIDKTEIQLAIAELAETILGGI
ncbi:MAG: hypothetical protein GX938_10895 [Spirochaetales bacterium]|nr:hypothetical protein [Spirochaetales bacterium]